MERDSISRQNNTILCRSGRAKTARLLLFLVFCILLGGIPPMTGYASTEKTTSDWAYFNDGSLQYEDNGSSWYSDMETVNAIAGMDINLQPVREAVYTYQRECIIALIDTGVDISHPALAGRLWKNDGEVAGDGIDNDGNGYVDDTDGWNFYKESNIMYNSRSSTEDAHGTHLAGTMVGNDASEDFMGVAGNVPSIRIMPVKTVGGLNQTGSIDNLIKGIRYAEQNEASICNISLSFEKWNEDVYQVMRDSKMLFVVVAGNGESDTHGTGFDLESANRYPACFELDNVIVVANLKCDGTLHYSSNYGMKYVDMAAPGTGIRSTSTHKSGYEIMTGTSMAAPMVSAAAALVYSEHTDWNIGQVRQALLSSVRKTDALEGLVRTGGMLDVAAAMEYKGESGGKPEETPSANETPSESEEPSASEIPSVSEKPDIGDDSPTVGVPEVPSVTQTPSVTQPPDSSMKPMPTAPSETGGNSTENEKPDEKTPQTSEKTAKKKTAGVKVRKVKWHKSGKNKNHLVFQVKGTQKADGVCLEITRKINGKKAVSKKYISTDTRKWKKVRLKMKTSKGQIVSVKIRMYHKVKKGDRTVRQCFGKSKKIKRA